MNCYNNSISRISVNHVQPNSPEVNEDVSKSQDASFPIPKSSCSTNRLPALTCHCAKHSRNHCSVSSIRIAILITDHAAREILAAVDRCYVISKGLVLCEGSPAEVKKHPEVKRQYLGNLDGDVHSPSANSSSEDPEQYASSGNVPAPKGAPIIPAPPNRCLIGTAHSLVFVRSRTVRSPQRPVSLGTVNKNASINRSNHSTL